jgi:hypothetical protein
VCKSKLDWVQTSPSHVLGLHRSKSCELPGSESTRQRFSKARKQKLDLKSEWVIPFFPPKVSTLFFFSVLHLNMTMPFKEALARLENSRVRSTRPLIPPQILQEDLPLYATPTPLASIKSDRRDHIGPFLPLIPSFEAVCRRKIF